MQIYIECIRGKTDTIQVIRVYKRENRHHTSDKGAVTIVGASNSL